ncbi:alcohol dehydrogenase catalytic domain-containing protein [Streptomyces sp. M19]
MGGICGSDIAYWRHGASGTAVLRHPLVLGHEVAGRIAAVGAGVGGLAPGRAVTVHPAQPVGDVRLPDRIAGRTNLHPGCATSARPPSTRTPTGVQRVPGGRRRAGPAAAGGRRHRARRARRALAVALHAVHRADPGAARQNGPGQRGGADRLPGRGRGTAPRRRHGDRGGHQPASLAVARAMGADETVDLAAGAALPADVEVVFEASGAAAALGPVLGATARGGTLVQVGNLPGRT